MWLPAKYVSKTGQRCRVVQVQCGSRHTLALLQTDSRLVVAATGILAPDQPGLARLSSALMTSMNPIKQWHGGRPYRQATWLDSGVHCCYIAFTLIQNA